MTDQTAETTEMDTDETHVEPDATATGATGATEDSAEARKGNPEAAKWRTKLRETEAQVSTLTERVASLQRGEVVRMATGPGLLIDGEDLFRDVELTDLLREDGDVDSDLVAEAVARIREGKPHLGKPYLDGDVGIGTKAGTKLPSWADVIAG